MVTTRAERRAAARAERRAAGAERRAAGAVRRAAGAERRALAFHQCPQCTYDLLTGEGERSCHYYACPYLPEALDVQCPTCTFNFYTREGNPECSDPPTCEFARTIARERVALARRWAEHATH